jgi:hypothetical protein
MWNELVPISTAAIWLPAGFLMVVMLLLTGSRSHIATLGETAGGSQLQECSNQIKMIKFSTPVDESIFLKESLCVQW